MNIHILGICGTFMGGLALLARSSGHRVSGNDLNIYPPMSDLLAQQGVVVNDGYDPASIPDDTELVIIGNALSRGNAAVEHVLNQRLPYTSGPQWLGEHFLAGKQVLAVAGTHGKTTTSAMLAWILDQAGLEPGFLIGGVPGNFRVSARAGGGDYFVVEADEYDTAFFDKRSKFVHYRPLVALLNNLEFDHADIFDDLAAIRRQFHHLVRTVPGSGRLIVNAADAELERVLDMGCWSPVERFGIDGDADWQGRAVDAAGQSVAVRGPAGSAAFAWPLCGRHNVANAVAAIAAAAAVGVTPAQAGQALAQFRPPRRRQELVGTAAEVMVLDDFAHHPTAIHETLAAIRLRWPQRRLVAIFEPRSATMRRGTHAAQLPDALAAADESWLVAGDRLSWQPTAALAGSAIHVVDSVDTLLARLKNHLQPQDVVVFMSNGAFDNAPRRLLQQLAG